MIEKVKRLRKIRQKSNRTQVTFRISEELQRKIKARVSERGTCIQNMMTVLINDYLKRTENMTYGGENASDTATFVL